MQLLNLSEVIAGAFGSGLALGRYIWPALRGRERDLVANAATDIARLNERLAAVTELAGERASAISTLESRLEGALQQANEAELQTVRLREREEILSRQWEDQARRSGSIERQLTAEFENIANRILKANAAELSDNSQKAVAAVLDPLRERIQEFHRKIETTYEAESRDAVSLREQIRWMVETSQRLGSQADGLARALRGDSQLLGRWGEVTLERILESAGLTEGREFVSQGRGLGLKTAAGGTQRPDVVILLPDDRSIVVDSKVPLAGYERLIAAPETERARYADQFVRDVKSHIDDLFGKRYQEHEKLHAHECVLLFVPVEGALAAALSRDAELFFYAWEQRVVLVGPSTLLMTLRTVAQMWRSELQATNAEEIAGLAGDLCDKLSASLTDFNLAAEKIAAASQAHSDAMRRLSTGKGNALAIGRRIRNLGVATRRNIPSPLTEIA